MQLTVNTFRATGFHAQKEVVEINCGTMCYVAGRIGPHRLIVKVGAKIFLGHLRTTEQCDKGELCEE